MDGEGPPLLNRLGAGFDLSGRYRDKDELRMCVKEKVDEEPKN